MPLSRSTVSPSSVVGALAASITACSTPQPHAHSQPRKQTHKHGQELLSTLEEPLVAKRDWATQRTCQPTPHLKQRWAGDTDSAPFPPHLQRRQNGKHTLHCSRCATGAVMTPPSAAGTNTSQGMVRKFGPLKIGPPPSKSVREPPLAMCPVSLGMSRPFSLCVAPLRSAMAMTLPPASCT